VCWVCCVLGVFGGGVRTSREKSKKGETKK